MNISIDKTELVNYVTKQIKTFYPDKFGWDLDIFNRALDITLQRLEYTLSKIKLPSFNKDNKSYFYHLNTDQYAMFLYLLSNTLWREYNNDVMATKVMYLNKTLHSINCMYDTMLPDIFCFIHIVGTVLGKATYSDYLTVCQGVTVGTHNGCSPIIGEYVSLLPHSAIIGKSNIGNKVAIGIGARVYNQKIEEGKIVINSTAELIIKPTQKIYSENIYF